MPNADYLVLPARSSGFSPGVAKSEQLNTVWRQASVIASTIAKFIADSCGNDVFGDGDLQTLQENLKLALNKQASGRLLGIKTFSSNGTYTPTQGTKKILVKVWGGGGSNTDIAGAGGPSGSGGGYAEGLFEVPTGSASVTVGTGGAEVAASGGNGGASSFGSLINCGGGTGGTEESSTKYFASGRGVSGYVIVTEYA